jgi:hypothetical protein
MDAILPKQIEDFIDATNAGDTVKYLTTFSDNAYIYDWGREFSGRNGASQWNETDNIGKQAHFELQGITQTAPNVYMVEMLVTGNGFNGLGKMEFTLQGNLIHKLIIR